MSKTTLLLSGVAAVAVVAALTMGFGGGDRAGDTATAPANEYGAAETPTAEASTAGTATAAASVATAAAGQSSTAETGAAAADAQSTTPAAEPTTPADASAALAAKGYALEDIVIGDTSATVTIVEYASLTCPHCAAFHNDVLPTLTERYIATGKANLVIREVYFDQLGLFAAALARCGGPKPYEAFVNVLFKQQADWASGDQQEAAEKLRKIGRLGGLSDARIDECLGDQAYLAHLYDRFRTEAEADQIEATPTFIVNGEKLRGARSADEIGAAIDKALGG